MPPLVDSKTKCHFPNSQQFGFAVVHFACTHLFESKNFGFLAPGFPPFAAIYLVHVDVLS